MLRDAGKKMEMGMSPTGGKYYPHLDLNTEQLPEIATWEVGKEYELVIKVKMVEHSLEKSEGKTSEEGCFEVKEVGVMEYPMTKEQKLAKQKLGLK